MFTLTLLLKFQDLWNWRTFLLLNTLYTNGPTSIQTDKQTYILYADCRQGPGLLVQYGIAVKFAVKLAKSLCWETSDSIATKFWWPILVGLLYLYSIFCFKIVTGVATIDVASFTANFTAKKLQWNLQHLLQQNQLHFCNKIEVAHAYVSLLFWYQFLLQMCHRFLH